MRLKLTLHHAREALLPINYQYYISSWIYNTLWKANPVFAEQLHNRGYELAHKKYKLFCFGTLRPSEYRIVKKGQETYFQLKQAPTSLELSFYLEDALRHFMVGLFKDQRFHLAGVSFTVSLVQVLPEPVFESTMRYRMLSPLCVAQGKVEEKHPQYISPEESDFPQLLLNNLLGKQQAFVKRHRQAAPALDLSTGFDFKLLNKAKTKLYHIKETQIRGYLFDFELTAPPPLQSLGYYAGFGEKNAGLGMGMVGQIKY